MNRGSQVMTCRWIAVKVDSFNEAPIHESGK